jgi:DNA-binding Lrp family transcriptional regulator
MFNKPEGMVLMRAYILVRFEADNSRQVIGDLSKLKDVISADLVTGPYDAIIVVEAKDLNEIAELVVAKVSRISGIASTITCQAAKNEPKKTRGYAL